MYSATSCAGVIGCHWFVLIHTEGDSLIFLVFAVFEHAPIDVVCELVDGLVASVMRLVDSTEALHAASARRALFAARLDDVRQYHLR